MDKLFELISNSTSPFHTVLAAEDELKSAGFSALKLNEKWNLKIGGKYYLKVYDSTLFAFTVGKSDGPTLKIATAHTDFPCFKLKPNCEIKENGFAKLNVEIYGGMIYYSWLDRPLSVAGKVCLKSNDIYKPEIRFVDFDKPILIVPSLAIHLNKDVNKGVELNAQKNMLPICDLTGDDISEDFFMEQLAIRLNVDKNDILEYELYAYQVEQGSFVGFEDKFYSSPRLDNITSVRACLDGIIAAGNEISLNASYDFGINLIGIFDNEEIGSGTKQGAASLVFPSVLEKIYASLGKDEDDLKRDISDGLMLSVDVSHCVHPNYVDKNDITNKDILNGGVCVKYAAKQSYATDCVGGSIVYGLCDKAGVKYQKFVNRSDGTSGSTLGSISSTKVPMKTVDVGVPLLAMHSARELMGVEDMKALSLLMCEFFKY